MILRLAYNELQDLFDNNTLVPAAPLAGGVTGTPPSGTAPAPTPPGPNENKAPGETPKRVEVKKERTPSLPQARERTSGGTDPDRRRRRKSKNKETRKEKAALRESRASPSRTNRKAKLVPVQEERNQSRRKGLILWLLQIEWSAVEKGQHLHGGPQQKFEEDLNRLPVLRWDPESEEREGPPGSWELKPRPPSHPPPGYIPKAYGRPPAHWRRDYVPERSKGVKRKDRNSDIRVHGPSDARKAERQRKERG